MSAGEDKEFFFCIVIEMAERDDVINIYLQGPTGC
jgi:hypothetical protein